MAKRRTRRLPWFERTLLGAFGAACFWVAIIVAGPRLSFDGGVDLSFHFSSILSFFTCLIIVLMLFALSWLSEQMAGARIDIEREAQDMAFYKAFNEKPEIEVIRALSPDPKSAGDS